MQSNYLSELVSRLNHEPRRSDSSQRLNLGNLSSQGAINSHPKNGAHSLMSPQTSGSLMPLQAVLDVYQNNPYAPGSQGNQQGIESNNPVSQAFQQMACVAYQGLAQPNENRPSKEESQTTAIDVRNPLAIVSSSLGENMHESLSNFQQSAVEYLNQSLNNQEDQNQAPTNHTNTPTNPFHSNTNTTEENKLEDEEFAVPFYVNHDNNETQNEKQTSREPEISISQQFAKKRGRKPLDPSQKKQPRRRTMMKEKKQPKLVYACPHTDKKFYAKGFCQACYHSRGRTKLANNCDHPDRPNHALGLCKNCYFSQFARKKREEKKAVKEMTAGIKHSNQAQSLNQTISTREIKHKFQMLSSPPLGCMSPQQQRNIYQREQARYSEPPGLRDMSSHSDSSGTHSSYSQMMPLNQQLGLSRNYQ